MAELGVVRRDNPPFLKKPFEDAPPEIQDLALFTSELHKESARGAVLISASRCDEVLERILIAFFCEVSTAQDLLTGPNAPLGTFSSRINIAYALGLIQQDEYRDLNIIRKIRNEFGHSWKEVGFNTRKIAALCLTLPWLGPTEDKFQNEPKGRFNMCVCMLLTDLLWRERLVARERRTQKAWEHRFRH